MEFSSADAQRGEPETRGGWGEGRLGCGSWSGGRWIVRGDGGNGGCPGDGIRGNVNEGIRHGLGGRGGFGGGSRGEGEVAKRVGQDSRGKNDLVVWGWGSERVRSGGGRGGRGLRGG